MEEHMRKFTLVAALVVVAAFVFVGTAVKATLFSPDPEFQLDIPVAENAHASVALPERVRIPVLAIDTRVEQVGINTKGNMAAPSNYSDAGWYKYGTRPGEKGSAVLAGHLDNGLALDGVFRHLDQLEVGDDIYVETKEGKSLHFVVSATAVYPYTGVPTEMLFTRDDKARLNLITCGGGWLKDAKTYSERLVVYAVLMP